LFRYGTEDIERGIVSCTFNHWMRTAAPSESKITSDAGHMERDFVIKHNSGCKQYDRRLEVLIERYKCVAEITAENQTGNVRTTLH
jgi:hypothetical protein